MTRMKKATPDKTKPQNSLTKGRNPVLEDKILKGRLEMFRYLIFNKQKEEMFDMVRESPENMKLAVELLDDPDAKVRANAADFLSDAAERGMNISAAIPALAGLLHVRNMFGGFDASEALAWAAIKNRGREAALKVLIEALESPDSEVLISVCLALSQVARKGVDITCALPYLEKLIVSDKKNVVEFVTEAIGYAVSNHISRKAAMEMLVKLSGSENAESRAGAVYAFKDAAQMGADVSIPNILKAIGDGNPVIKKEAMSAMVELITNSDEEGRSRIVTKIMEFTRSGWFQDEMERNSVAFEDIVKGIVKLFRIIKIIETEGHYAGQ